MHRPFSFCLRRALGYVTPMRRVIVSLALLTACGSTPVTVATDAGADVELDTFGPPQTYAYLVDHIAFDPVVDGSRAQGFNLDNVVSTGGSACNERQDLDGLYGETGVDNQLAMLIPALETQLSGQHVSDLVQNDIASGDFILIFELTDVNSFVTDGQVGVRIYRMMLNETDRARYRQDVTNMRPAAGLVFARTTPVVTVETGRIQNGRLQVSFPNLAIPLMSPSINFTLNIRNGLFGARVTATGLQQATLGGMLSVSEVVAGIPPNIREQFRSIVEGAADLSPLSGMCQSLSMGVGISTVAASISN